MKPAGPAHAAQIGAPHSKASGQTRAYGAQPRPAFERSIPSRWADTATETASFPRARWLRGCYSPADGQLPDSAAQNARSATIPPCDVDAPFARTHGVQGQSDD